MTMRFFILLCTATFTAGSVNAAPHDIPSCPPPMEFAEQRSALMEELRQSRHPAAGAYLAKRLASIMATAPNQRAQGLLEAGLEMRKFGDLDGSNTALDALVEYCPAFAEGYHQRALTHIAQGDLETALSDLDNALDRTPDHLAALASKVSVLRQLGRHNAMKLNQKRLQALTPGIPLSEPRSDAPGLDV